MTLCAHEPSNRVEPLKEGICPTCAVQLEREDDCGRCPCCRVGWSLRQVSPDVVEVAIHPSLDFQRP